MTDIVERLREWPSNHDDAIEAADEIERLRKENELLRSGWCKESEKRMTDWDFKFSDGKMNPT